MPLPAPQSAKCRLKRMEGKGMKIPVDTKDLTFLCTAPAEPVLDFETKQPRSDENGEPLFAVQLVAIADGSAEIISVKVSGKPMAIDAGVPVRVSGLVATPWQMGERFGISYRAEKVERTAASTPAQGGGSR